MFASSVYTRCLGLVLLVVGVLIQGSTSLPTEHGVVELDESATVLKVEERAASPWQQEATAKNQRANSKIPAAWILSPATVQGAKKQQRLLGSNNKDKSIEDFIRTLPQANFTNPYVPGVTISANKTITITNTDPVDLVTAMPSKRYTAVEVVTAFCLRSAINPSSRAVKAAQDLDKYFAANGKLKGGLHGLPVTFKDVFHTADMETSGSFVGWFEPPKGSSPPQTQADHHYATIHPTEKNSKTFDSNVTQMLKGQGAIPIAKTSVMQTTWALDNDNNYLGFLTNPYNLNLSAGGSSGGEGVLQALGGAAFGIGEDSGGSISMPSSLHDLYSLKPSSGYHFQKRPDGTEELLPIPGRISMANAVNYASGIMARSLRAVQYIYENTASASAQAAEEQHKPRFAYVDNACYEHGQKGSASRVRAKSPYAWPPRSQLIDTNIQVPPLKWNGSATHNISDVQGVLARTDDIIDIVYYKNQTGEPFVPLLEVPSDYNPQPWDSTKQKALDAGVSLRDQHRKEYETMFKTHNINALFMPTFASTDWAKGAGDYAVPYTSWVNVFNAPSVTMFVTYASKDLDKKPANFKGMSQADEDHMKLYDPEAVDGTPFSIMILGRVNGETELLQAAQVIQQALQKS